MKIILLCAGKSSRTNLGYPKCLYKFKDGEMLIEKNLKVLIQVNVSEEVSKSGINANDLMPLAEMVIESKCLDLKGLMALPSPAADGKINEKEYEKMNVLSDQLKNHYSPADELSLGTSQDFEMGIKHGSTMIRVGESIFGKR